MTRAEREAIRDRIEWCRRYADVADGIEDAGQNLAGLLDQVERLEHDQAELDDLRAKVARWEPLIEQRDELADELDDARSANERLRDLLREIEWSGRETVDWGGPGSSTSVFPACPLCRGRKPYTMSVRREDGTREDRIEGGHASDCRIAATLKEHS